MNNPEPLFLDISESEGSPPVGSRAPDIPIPSEPGGTPTTRTPILTFSSLLRGLGALVIVGAFTLFLFQSWRDGDPLTRYMLLLGHTLSLTLIGFGVGHLLREPKGARLFIALALGAIGVDFAFLGGLTYPHLTWETLPATQQTLFLSLGSLLALVGVAIGLLGSATWLGFRVMARRSAGLLTGLYLLGNGLLLIPTRDTRVIALLLAMLSAVLLLSVVHLSRRDPTLATPEGWFGRLILSLPLIIAGGRSLWFYAPGSLFFTTLALIAYLGLRQGLIALPENHGLRAGCAWIALGLAVLVSLFAYDTLRQLGSLPIPLRWPLTAALLAGFLVDLSFRGVRRGAELRQTAALLLGWTPMVNLLLFWDPWNAFFCLVTGMGLVSYGYLLRRRFLFGSGIGAMLLGLGWMGTQALERFSLGGWTGLVLLGIVTILAGSLVERYGARVRGQVQRWRNHFDAPRIA